MTNLNNLIKEKNIKALILDMDGVVTNTAALHAEAWKTLCDSYLRQRGEQEGKKIEPFNFMDDYRAFVHGVPRLDAMRNFMKSRGVEVPEGSPEDDENENTIVGLGERKDFYFHELLKQNGVVVFENAVQWIQEKKEEGMKTAIVSASRNCLTIIRRANLEKLFDVRVDRVVAAELKLQTKPAPDIYLEAARQLGVQPHEAAVFEDSVDSIKGAKQADFGLVVGVDHTQKRETFESSGADLVIRGFAAEVKVDDETTINS